MLGIGIGVLAVQQRHAASGDEELVPPEGFAFLVDNNDAFILTVDGAYVVAPTA